MEAKNFQPLVVLIQDEFNLKPEEQAKKMHKLALDCAEEIKKAVDKCQSISEIRGKAATIVSLRIICEPSNEIIGITYISNGESHSAAYTKQEFYDL
jgi:hypothetical protein